MNEEVSLKDAGRDLQRLASVVLEGGEEVADAGSAKVDTFTQGILVMSNGVPCFPLKSGFGTGTHIGRGDASQGSVVEKQILRAGRSDLPLLSQSMCEARSIKHKTICPKSCRRMQRPQHGLPHRCTRMSHLFPES